MLNVLVLEDEENSRKALIRMLKRISEEITVAAAADLASARLLLDGTVSFDLFLLDINLDHTKENDCSGITFANEVRRMRKYEFTPLVMVTSVAGLEMDAYRSLRCYQYIVKPYDQKEIEKLVDKLLFHLRSEQKPAVVVKKNGINYRILCEDIVFCSAIPRGVCLCLKKEQIEIPYLSVRSLLEKLPEDQFFQCHRMYLVNRDAVRYYDLVNQMIEVEGYEDKIDIGVTFKAEVRRQMEKEQKRGEKKG